MIARMFAKIRSLHIVLDEPTTGMDAVSKDEFYDLNVHRRAHRHGKAVLMITHGEGSPKICEPQYPF